MEDKVLKIINTFGVRPQQRKLMEEVFELQEAIICYEMSPHGIYRYIRTEYKSNIEEELADVLVLLEQIINYYQIDKKEIKEIMNEKIDRTLERIESGYYK